MIDSNKCIGCQACVELCPTSAISFRYDQWGTGRAFITEEKCIGCNKCQRICPAEIQQMNPATDIVYAAISKMHRSTGSSGGFFYELASMFLEIGGIVYGAAFDENLRLVHSRVDSIKDLLPLCKSKYIHSDMKGVFQQLDNDLKNGKNVLFVGTPCQAGAVKNTFANRYDENLTIVDFLCHGTAPQKLFDLCIHAEEKKKRGTITDFQFRAKSRKAEHSFTYTLRKNDRDHVVSGYHFEFPFYYSYLKYTVFNDACYFCPYAKETRVGDITLGDFWKIQNYNPKLHDQSGVSMLSINSQKGNALLGKLKDKLDLSEYPLNVARQNNQSFREPVPYPPQKRKLEQILIQQGEEELVKELICPHLTKHLIYARTPSWVKHMYQKIRGKS